MSVNILFLKQTSCFREPFPFYRPKVHILTLVAFREDSDLVTVAARIANTWRPLVETKMSSAVTNTQWVYHSTNFRTSIISFCMYDNHQLPMSNDATHVQSKRMFFFHLHEGRLFERVLLAFNVLLFITLNKYYNMCSVHMSSFCYLIG
jgi:hypothetical protein